MKLIYVIEVELERETPDLSDKIAGRIYTLPEVADVRVIAEGEAKDALV